MAELPQTEMDWARLNDLIHDKDEHPGSVYDELCAIDLRYIRPAPINSGGMKQICRTKDAMTGRPVAMAILREDMENGEASIENFLREARITAHLQHSNIVPVYDIGLDDEGAPFFTMKFLSGESLGKVIEKLSKGVPGYAEEYPLPALLDIFMKLAGAVAYAHSSGVIHLDLKPGNVQVCEFGEVRVYDWGLAKIVNTDCEAPSSSILDDEPLYNSCVNFLTVDGYLKGTPGYMAPEQARRGRPKDERTDIYSLGCILYAILTWACPIEGDNVDEIIEHTRSGTFTRPRKRRREWNLPRSLEAVVLKAMALEPDDRYQSVERLIIDVNNYRNGFATKAEDASFGKQLQLLIRRNPKVFALLFGGLLLIAGIVAYYTQEVVKREREARQALYASEINLQRYIEAREWRAKKEAAPDHYNLAVKAFETGDYDDCLARVRVALDYDNSLMHAHELLGNLHIVRMNFPAAIKAYKKAKSSHSTRWINISDTILKQLPEFRDGPERPGLSDALELVDNLRNVRRDPLFKRMTRWYATGDLSIDAQTLFAKQVAQIEAGGKAKLNIRYQILDDGVALDLSGNKANVDLRLFGKQPVRELDLSNSPTQRLISISRFPLRRLNLNGARAATTLEDLKGMHGLQELDLRKTQMRDITGLRGMSLKKVDIRGAKVDRRWLSVLLNECDVEKLYLDESLSFHEEVIARLNEKTELIY